MEKKSPTVDLSEWGSNVALLQTTFGHFSEENLERWSKKNLEGSSTTSRFGDFRWSGSDWMTRRNCRIRRWKNSTNRRKSNLSILTEKEIIKFASYSFMIIFLPLQFNVSKKKIKLLSIFVLSFFCQNIDFISYLLTGSRF